MEKRYPALTITIFAFKIFAILSLILGFVILLDGALAEFNKKIGLIGFFIMASVAISYFAFAEIIKLQINNELNTRKTAQLLESLIREIKKQGDQQDTTKPRPSIRPTLKTANKDQHSKIISLIKKLNSEGMTAEQIVEEMNAGNIPSIKVGQVWSITTINEVLSN